MKKLILTISTALLLNSANSQEINLQIVPYPVVDTAEKFQIKIVSLEKDSLDIYYKLYNNRRIIEDGNVKVPRAFLSILAQNPVDTALLNPVLQTWGIEAIKQED